MCGRGHFTNNRVLPPIMGAFTHRMNDTEILSAFHEPAAAPVARVRPVLDACQVGVALRAVLFVQAVLAVGAMFGTDSFMDWLTRLALLTGAALPATLLWLVSACALLRLLAAWAAPLQYGVGVALGALAGAAGSGLLALGEPLARPPWLASASAGALLSALLMAMLALRERGKTPAATTARLAELQSRIRPHFLFNTLNSAIALVRAEPARAEALLEDLSDLFRHALAEQGEAVPLAQEIELARRYLAIEQVRFGERLRVDWALDPAAAGARLPPLMLQPLVENAVRHGVEPSTEGAQIRISSERRGERVVLKVTNTVPAGQGAHGLGLALDNVRARLALLHDVQAGFQSALREGVFQVRIEVPAK